MLKTFTATLTPMLIMFLFLFVGYLMRKTKILPENTATVLSKAENYIFVPALILNTFMNYCTVSSVTTEYTILIYSIISVLIALITALLLSKIVVRKKSYARNIYRYALTFANYGFMGNAIVPKILGYEQLYRYMLFTLPLNLTCYVYGVTWLIPEKEEKGNPLKKLINPIFISIVIGATIGLCGATYYIPSFITEAISDCADCMGPIGMLLTGFVIGGYNIKQLLSNKKVYLATALRLIVLPAFFIVLLRLLKADDFTLTLTLFAYATPLGLNTVVFPAAYGGDTSTGASMAMISHTLCVITIPIMYALLYGFICI